MSVETHLLYAVHGPIVAALLVSLIVSIASFLFIMHIKKHIMYIHPIHSHCVYIIYYINPIIHFRH